MQTNAVPHYDDSINTTGCCAKFNSDDWEGRIEEVGCQVLRKQHWS